MNRKMEPIEVYVGNEGHVVMKQDGYPGDDNVIFVSPHQVDTLIEWLKVTKAEALETQSAIASEG